MTDYETASRFFDLTTLVVLEAYLTFTGVFIYQYLKNSKKDSISKILRNKSKTLDGKLQ